MHVNLETFLVLFDAFDECSQRGTFVRDCSMFVQLWNKSIYYSSVSVLIVHLKFRNTGGTYCDGRRIGAAPGKREQSRQRDCLLTENCRASPRKIKSIVADSNILCNHVLTKK